MNHNSRIPVIALPYSEKHKAVPKELMVDYETGNIYVVSATDKSVIFDITAKILSMIDKLNGNNISVDIEGIGKVNLVELLEQIKLQLEDAVLVDDEGTADIYIPREERLDSVSIESKYKKIQLTGFEKAENGMIAQKFDNGLRWIYPPQPGDIGLNPDNPGMPNPDDGLSTKVHLIEPVEGKIFLRASRRQKTVNLARDVQVILPRILDEFTEVYWFMRSYTVRPKLVFEDRVHFNDINIQPDSNSSHIYKFVTWDSGENWFAEVEKYK